MISIHQSVREHAKITDKNPKGQDLDLQWGLFAKSFNRFSTSPLGLAAQATTALYTVGVLSPTTVW